MKKILYIGISAVFILLSAIPTGYTRENPPATADDTTLSHPWVVYASALGWMRIGTRVEFEAPWKKKDEIWGGRSEEALEKTMLRKGYKTRKDAIEALCNQLTRVQLHIAPALRGKPTRYITARFEGKQYYLWLTPGFSAGAVAAMAQGKPFNRHEYDWKAEWAALKKYHITPRHVFPHPQWLIHAVQRRTRQGPEDLDMWLCFTRSPDENNRFTLPLQDGTVQTYTADKSEGPFRDSFTLARVMDTHGIKQIDLWPPATSAARRDVQPRVTADMIPENARDYGEGVLPRQPILPKPSLADWVIYSLEGGWLHVATRYEFERPWMKREVIWGGTGEDIAQKTLLAPGGDKKFHSRKQALRFLFAGLKDVTTQYRARSRPRETVVGTFQGQSYKLRLDRGVDGENVLEYKNLQYDYAAVWDCLARAGITPLRRFGKSKLVHATGHGTISGPVKDDIYMLVPVGAVRADGKGMKLADGTGGWFLYTIDYASPVVSTNYELSALQRRLIGGNPAIAKKLNTIKLYAQDRYVTAEEVPDTPTNQGGAQKKSRIVLYRITPGKAQPGDTLGITLLAEGIEKGARLEFGPGIDLKDLVDGGRDSDTPHHLWYCTADIEETAKPGKRNLSVTNPDGDGATLAGFQVIAEAVDDESLPPLPLVIPAAALEGSLKETLIDFKSTVKNRLKTAGKLKAERTRLVSETDAFNSLKMLAAWYNRDREILSAEKKARQAAESFFTSLAAVINRLSDEEKATLEAGLSERAFALRRERTVQRRLIRERSGLGTIDSIKEFRIYFNALGRLTWCNLEIDALVRMWGAINTARMLLHGRFDPYWLNEAAANPAQTAAVNKERQRLFEALIDLGISSLLGSESRYEAVMDARKDRLYGLKQWWRQTGRDFEDPRTSRAAGGAFVQLFSLGFSVFDVVCGMGADAIKGGIYHQFGADFRTRAEKLEDLAIKNWEDTQRKLLLLRLLKRVPLAQVEKMASDLAIGVPVDTLPIAPGKIDGQDIQSIMADRAFNRATGGGLLKILGVTLTTFDRRCAMALVIAKDQTELLHRDTQAAYRLEQGRDAKTGETTWGTILSPMTWADIAAKNLIQAENFNLRSTHIHRLKQQIDVMDRFIGKDVLLDVQFDFTSLPEKELAEHLTLYAKNASYVQFVIRVTEERAARTIHRWDSTIKNLSEDPRTAKKLAARLGQFITATKKKNRSDLRRKQALDYEDLVYAWDLSGALALAKQLAPRNPTYGSRVKLLLDAVATESVKKRGIDLFRNVGDMGVNAAIMGAGGKLLGFGSPATAGGAAVAAGQQPSFARYVYGVLNPLSHGPGEILEEAITEVTTDIGVSVAGEKYEALINKVAELVIARLADLVSAQIEAGETKKADEKNRHPELDSRKFETEFKQDPVVQEAEALAKTQARAANESNPDVRESIDRQSKDQQRAYANMLAAVLYHEQSRKVLGDVKQSNDTARQKATEYARYTRQAETLIRPKAIIDFEQKITDQKGDFFTAGKGLDIENLRADLKLLLQATHPDHHPRIKALLVKIDAERTRRIQRAMGKFFTQFGTKIKGVILNGTRKGNPEYKGIFSDRDLTVVVIDPGDVDAVQKAVAEAFLEEGIRLNVKNQKGSADIEAMVQTTLPGDVSAITTGKELLRWAQELPRDDTRYLSVGGSIWVAFYNAMNGGTMSHEGETAVVDASPDLTLLPTPPISPLFAHGIVLDVARYDMLQDVSDIQTDDAAEMLGARSRNVLRAVDALIWAQSPDLVRARTREAAIEKGYHALIVEDAKIMVERGLLTPAEFKIIQILADLKRGKTAQEALGLNPADGEANRSHIVEIWNEANALMKKTFTGTRQVYLKQLNDIATGKIRDPAAKKLLFTVVFGNWNAVRQINDTDHPGKLKQLTGSNAADPVKEMMIDDRLAMDPIEGLDTPPTPPRPPAEGDSGSNDMVPGDSGDKRPAEGIDPNPAPTAIQTVTTPSPAPAPPLEKIFQPFTEAEMPADTKENLPTHAPSGEQIGFDKEVFDEPFEAVNEAVAFEFGRQLDVNIPLTEVVTGTDGEIIGGIMRFVPGNNLVAFIDGMDPFSKEKVTLPDGLTMTALMQQPEFRRQYILDKILSAVLGDFDRRAMNLMLTPEGKLVPVDHAAAMPMETDGNGNPIPITPEIIIDKLKERLEGPAEAARKRNAPERDLDKVMALTWEEIAPLWNEAKSKLPAAFLEKAAGKYGPDAKQQVMDTWQMRLANLESVLMEMYGAPSEGDTGTTSHRGREKPSSPPVRPDTPKTKDEWGDVLSPKNPDQTPPPGNNKKWGNVF